MILRGIDTLTESSKEMEVEYFILGLLTHSRLIHINSSYFFVDNQNRIFNIKYGDESLLSTSELLRMLLVCKRDFSLKNYKLYLRNQPSLERKKVSYIVTFNYTKNKLRKEVFRYYNRIQRMGFFSQIDAISPENLKAFYSMYKEFSLSKGFTIGDYSFFQDIILKYKDHFYIYNTYTKEGTLVGSVILLRFTNRIIVMYGGYNDILIRKGLKYFVNKGIIDKFQNDNNIGEIIFGTGIDETNREDSVLRFKLKFGELYMLYILEGFF